MLSVDEILAAPEHTNGTKERLQKLQANLEAQLAMVKQMQVLTRPCDTAELCHKHKLLAVSNMTACEMIDLLLVD